MDHQMYHYATVSKALEELAEKGFTVDFNLEADRIKDCGDCFEIVHIYRYEGATDHGDEATVYGIKSDKGEKGVYVSGDLSFSEDEAAQTLHELVIKGRQPSE
ncbi:hypothetical protein H9W95_12780 [Flavobacterium lindanitolerans]|nr:hypothetical protein [Flavobacterium lindanitolerans]